MYYSKVKDPRDANQITRAYMDAILIEPRYLDSVVPISRWNCMGAPLLRR